MSATGGTIILCDQVYQAQGGKYVIAGTYTTVEVQCQSLRRASHAIAGLSLYTRLRPERLGTHACEAHVRDESQPPWAPPLLRCQWEARVTERCIRLFEFILITPGFTVQLADDPAFDTSEDVTLRYAIELRVDGEVVAGTPLDLRFLRTRPPGSPGPPPG